MADVKVKDIVLFHDDHEYKGYVGVVRNMETIRGETFYEIVIHEDGRIKDVVIAVRREFDVVGEML